MPIVHEETFAPLLYLIKYRTLEEAIARGTDLPAVWSDYEWLLLRQKDIERLCSTITAQAKAAPTPTQIPATGISTRPIRIAAASEYTWIQPLARGRSRNGVVVASPVVITPSCCSCRCFPRGPGGDPCPCRGHLRQ